jgi:hypothetical protein
MLIIIQSDRTGDDKRFVDDVCLSLRHIANAMLPAGFYFVIVLKDLIVSFMSPPFINKL